jgi:hypothetical protein
MLKHLTAMLCASVFFALFGGGYEQFSHQVYSYYMIYAFALPLILGALPWALALGRGWRIPEGVPGLWNAAVLTLTLGSVLRGVLDIYGTTSHLLFVYPVAAAALSGFALLRLLRPREEHPALPGGREAV